MNLGKVVAWASTAALVITLGGAGWTPSAIAVDADLPARTTSDSGSKTCTGRGYVAPGVAHPARWSARMNVKLTGPPTSPGFGTRVIANPSAPAPDDKDGYDGYSRWFYPTKYRAATFGATTPAPNDWPIRVGAQCTRQKAPTQTLRASKNLGSKSCSGRRRPTMYAFTHGNVWMYFRHNRTGPLQRIHTLRSPVVASSGLFINDRTIYDARIEVRWGTSGENWLPYYYLRCNVKENEDPYLN